MSLMPEQLNETQEKKIARSDVFKNLLNMRNVIRYTLSVLLVITFAFFIGGIAFYNEWFAQSFSANSIIPNGIYFTFWVIIVMLLLEFVYIYLSENKLEVLQEKVINEAQKSE